MSPSWASERRTDRLKRREADRAHLAGLETRQIGERDVDPLGKLGEGHPPVVQDIVELDDNGHVTPSLRGLDSGQIGALF